MTGPLLAVGAVALGAAAAVVAAVALAFARAAARQAEELGRRVAELERALGTAPAPAAPAAAGFDEQLAVSWFTGIGALVLLVGVGSCFEYAVDAGWIGAEARVAAGLLVAAVVLGAAERLHGRTQPVLVHALAAVGIGILYLSIWAAHALYGIAAGEVALVLFLATTAAGAAAAVRYRAEVLLLCALGGGLLAPAVISGAGGGPGGRWLHLLAITGGTFALAWRRQLVTAAALALVCADVGAAVLLADAGRSWSVGLAASAGAAFAVLGVALSRRVPWIANLCAGQGAALLAAAIGLRFAGPWPTVLWAVLGIALLATGLVAASAIERWLGLGALALALGKLLLVDVWLLGPAYRTAVFLAVGALLLGAGFLHAHRSVSTPWRR